MSTTTDETATDDVQTCKNGRKRCPGPYSDDGTRLPCFDCFMEYADDD